MAYHVILFHASRDEYRYDRDTDIIARVSFISLFSVIRGVMENVVGPQYSCI